MLKICYITNAGDTLHTYRWIGAFVERKFEIHVITSRPNWKIPNAQMHFLPHPYPIPKTAMLQYLIRIRTFLHHLKPDIVHVFPLTPFEALITFAGIPYVVTLWGSDVYKHHGQKRIPWIKRMCLRHASCVTGDSLDLCNVAIFNGAKRDKTHLVQFGVDLEKFNPTASAVLLRKRMGLPENTPVILSPRSFQPIYNIEKIIEAAEILEKTRLKATFLFLTGTGNSESIQKLVKSKLKHALVFPPLSYEEMPDLYAVADVMVSIPVWDGTPVSLLEAMALGCIPVVSDTRSIREWITDEENGYVVAIDGKTVADAIVSALRRGDREDIVRKNRLIIEERANHKKEMDRMALYYEEIALRARRLKNI
ncbi:MAG: glycosyltransferase family 4 protein [Nitrospira sp.]|nr:glycosyltransferase family 4 protein [Nitrospira sp.]